MKLYQALRNIFLIQTTALALWYVPVVRAGGEKGSMDSKNNINNENGIVERELAALLGSNNNVDRYPYSRNYICIIEPDNFVTLSASNGGIDSAIESLVPFGQLPDLVGSSIVQFGNVYEPSDIVIVNKFDGIEPGDPQPQVLVDKTEFLGFRYAGNRQPKFPIPPGDKAYFFHGECVATSTQSLPNPLTKGLPTDDTIVGTFVDSLTQTSHTCLLNLCLGGGGFDCIAIYAGTAFVFDFGQQIAVGGMGFDDNDSVTADVSLPPPFPATIMGGTGSFEGIEGTVDIATICGTAGALIPLEKITPPIIATGPIKIGYIVQTIRVKSNMPLPVAP